MTIPYILAIALLFNFSMLKAEKCTEDNLIVTHSKREIKDHGLPDDHPIKAELDEIFKSMRVLATPSSYKRAGFNPSRERRKGLIVTTHPLLPGYLVKMYLETAGVNELDLYMKRINGALLIQDALDRFGYNNLMKVPKKWIYTVPNVDVDSAGRFPKKYILVVEDMEIFSENESQRLYRKIITEAHLDALFNILTSCLLSDSTFLPNIPFCRDYRIAFIDTEFAGTSLTIWSRLHRIGKHLSPEMRAYWESILLNNPRPKDIGLLTEGATGSVDEAFESTWKKNLLQFYKIDKSPFDIDIRQFNLEPVANINSVASTD